MPLSITLAAALFAQAAPAPPAMLGGGTIAVARPAPVGRRPAPTLVFAEGIEDALIDAGFTAIPDTAHARQVATFDVKRTAHGTVRSAGPAAGPVQAGGGMDSAAMGASLGFGLGSGGARLGQLVATELTIRIARRGDSGPPWEGRAVTHQIAGSRGDSPAALAKKLTQAVLRNLGGPSGLLVSVP
ncbi:hypothetical protein [Sphingomonas sp.]|uniref:hypothetical protein n=1 Tax=Sphingomonas sp. TaxID=28214 RepID=UPI002DD6517E|nr:hypothetical protein [Sphingomonas sp.]